MKILVLGANGMLGNAMMRILLENKENDVVGTVRSEKVRNLFPENITECLLDGCDVENHDVLVQLFSRVQPELVINCVGMVKQLVASNDPLRTIPINTLLPHRLVGLCKISGSRLIHISTDCVFSGRKGSYKEEDIIDATDLYGMSKFLGELHEPGTVTLRTSIIGHELQSKHGLIDWFLSQQRRCNGFSNVYFSGLPTVVLAMIIRDIVIPRLELTGLYHVAAQSISKYDLLNLVAKVYGKKITIMMDDKLKIDRSLNADKFKSATGYVAPKWPELVEIMHSYY